MPRGEGIECLEHKMFSSELVGCGEAGAASPIRFDKWRCSFAIPGYFPTPSIPFHFPIRYLVVKSYLSIVLIYKRNRLEA